MPCERNHDSASSCASKDLTAFDRARCDEINHSTTIAITVHQNIDMFFILPNILTGPVGPFIIPGHFGRVPCLSILNRKLVLNSSKSNVRKCEPALFHRFE